MADTPPGNATESASPPPELARVVELLRSVSTATDPREVLQHYAEALHRGQRRGGLVSISRRGLGEGEYRITRQLLTDVDGTIERGNPWKDGVRTHVHTGGFLGGLIASGEPVLRNGLGSIRDGVLGPDAESFGNVMAVPLFDGGEPLNWAIWFRPESQPFSVEDLREALLEGNMVGGNVRLVQMAEQIREASARQDAEVERIGSIQRALLPERLPDIPGATTAVLYQTPAVAGGDYYTVRQMGVDGTEEGRAIGAWGLVIADVSGHGPAAAVVMAMLQSMLMAMPIEHQADAGAACSYLNRHLCSKRIEGTFVTAVIAGYHPDSGTLSYARAGHPLPMVRRGQPDGDGEVEVFSLEGEAGMPLGVMADAPYPSASIQLRGGDSVVLYTDGLEESRSPGGEFFARAGIEEALRDCSGSAGCLVDTLKTRLAEHEGGAPAGDDQTVLVLSIESVG